MRVFLTGKNGMVGRNLLEHAGARTVEWLTPGHGELDLLNRQAVFDYLAREKPDVIVHAAGKVGGIQANMREPVSFLTENMDMGFNVLLGARAAGVRRLINLGSSCMYPRDAENPLREEQVLKGQLEPTNEGYALAKCSVARLGDYISYEDDHFAYKTLIPCNLFGRWDKFDPQHSHMIPAVIRKLHEAKVTGLKEIDIWGDGQARREFMAASDLADCILKAIDDFDNLPSLMNVGIGTDYSINEYYRMIADVVGYQGDFVHDLSKPSGMAQKLTDVSLATQWGWQSTTPVEAGIRQAYDFFLSLDS